MGENEWAVSILWDEGTDVSHMGMLSISVRFIDTTVAPYVVRTRHLAFVEAHPATANNVARAIEDAVEENGISNRLAAGTADGASVNFGKDNGVFAKLRSKRPALLAIHCNPHKVQLAIGKAAGGSDMVMACDQALSTMYAYGARSDKRLHGLDAALREADAYHKALRLVRFVTTRWLSRKGAIKAVVSQIDGVAPFFVDAGTAANAADDTNTDAGASAAKLTILRNELKSPAFYLRLCYVGDFAEQVGAFSAFLQGTLRFFYCVAPLTLPPSYIGDNVDTHIALVMLDNIKQSFADRETLVWGEYTLNLLEKLPQDENGERSGTLVFGEDLKVPVTREDLMRFYLEVRLPASLCARARARATPPASSDSRPTPITFPLKVRSLRLNFYEALIDYFPPDKLLDALLVYDARRLPDIAGQDYVRYGQPELKFLAAIYGEPGSQLIEKEELYKEWPLVKQAMQQFTARPHAPLSLFEYLDRDDEAYPATLAVLSVLCVASLTNTASERMVSVLGNVKGATSASMTAATIDMKTRVVVNGPKMGKKAVKNADVQRQLDGFAAEKTALVRTAVAKRFADAQPKRAAGGKASGQVRRRKAEDSSGTKSAAVAVLISGASQKGVAGDGSAAAGATPRAAMPFPDDRSYVVEPKPLALKDVKGRLVVMFTKDNDEDAGDWYEYTVMKWAPAQRLDGLGKMQAVPVGDSCEAALRWYDADDKRTNDYTLRLALDEYGTTKTWVIVQSKNGEERNFDDIEDDE